MVTSALAIKETFMIKSQNIVSMVQTSKVITRWYCGYNFRLDLVLLNTWVFWVVSDLDATRHSQSNVRWKLVTATLLFIELGNWLPGYKSSQNARFRLGFRHILWKEMRFILSIKIPVITPPTISNWVCYTKMADQGIEILIIQDSDLGLGTQEYFQFSVYSPNWGSYQRHSCPIPRIKTEQDSMGLWSTDMFCVLHSCL